MAIPSWFRLGLLVSFCLGVVNGNDPPLVDLGPATRRVAENTTIGSVLFTINATDSDSSNVTCQPSDGDAEDLVRINTRSTTSANPNFFQYDVILKKRLDRDRDRHRRVLKFAISDGSRTLHPEIQLVIDDVNDNPPFLVNLPYRLSIPEGNASFINTVVYNVLASDPDQGAGGTPIYHLNATNPAFNETFVLENPLRGEITLTELLDYETRNFYQYTVSAKDLDGCPGEAGCYCNNETEPTVTCEGIKVPFIVTVTDVQDTPPVFEQLPYIASVNENATVGASVLTVTASDGDRGHPNTVNYSIVNDIYYPFTVDPVSGIITVSEHLDADTPEGRSYLFHVMATENDVDPDNQHGDTTTTTRVSIAVLDVNDNPPVFGATVYNASVQENTPNEFPINIDGIVNVTDVDQNENSRFRLSVMKDGQPYSSFYTLPTSDTVVQGFTTVMVIVNDTSVLDYEQNQTITFQLKATEEGDNGQKTTMATIQLHLQDMNDNSPVFVVGTVTKVNVTEHDRNGTALANFTATDDDSGPFGNVTYGLENPFGGKFAIDEISGELTKAGYIDRDQGVEQYSLVVTAQDNPGADLNQRRSTRHSLVITVLDINDNHPIFLTHPATVTVPENAENQTTLLTLQADDKDKGRNGEVRYEVLSITKGSHTVTQGPGLFAINGSTGEVFVNTRLEGNSGQFFVTLIAFDHGDEPQNGTTTITVDVNDVNLNEPVFLVPDASKVNTSVGNQIIPNVTIEEAQVAGTFIIQLRATDADSGKNGEVKFYVAPDLQGTFQSFTLDASTGNLSNKVELDADANIPEGFLQITLQAVDGGTPSLSSTVPFRVFLIDIDDNDPKFTPPRQLELEAREQSKAISVGFLNISTDADRDVENHVACYYLCGEATSDFTLDKATGELTLSEKLNVTKTPSVDLCVKVTKNCSLHRDHFITTSATNSSCDTSNDHSLLQVVVKVVDINDNPPVLNRGLMTVGLLYDAEIGTQIFDLTKVTTDKDSLEVNRENFYRLLGVYVESNTIVEDTPLNRTFSVSANGTVVTQRLFRSDESHSFVLRVKAFDNDGLTDVANLTVFLVSDSQRLKLILNEEVNDVVKTKDALLRALGVALDMEVIADKVVTHVKSDGTPDPDRTDLFIHARYLDTKEIVPTSELVNALDYNPDVLKIFQDYNVAYAGKLTPEDESDNKTMEKAFIIVTIALGIICVVLVIVLFNAISRYRRRLRAATTSAFVSTNTKTEAYVPPGTNRYYTSENPLYGSDVKPTDFNGPGDKDNDSLDENAVSGTKAEAAGEPDEEQELYLDMYDDDLGPGSRVNQLAMVLSEYDNQARESGPSSASHPPPYYTPSLPHDHPADRWSTPLNGHVKSDSGFNENDAFEYDLDNLQHTDI